jgi:hypothetical protein
MVCASPLNLGFSDFTSTETLSLSSIKSWESRTIMTPLWPHTGRILGNWRRNLMASSSTICSGCVHAGFVQAVHPARGENPSTCARDLFG